jgi:hypothetical protein
MSAPAPAMPPARTRRRQAPRRTGVPMGGRGRVSPSMESHSFASSVSGRAAPEPGRGLDTRRQAGFTQPGRRASYLAGKLGARFCVTRRARSGGGCVSQPFVGSGKIRGHRRLMLLRPRSHLRMLGPAPAVDASRPRGPDCRPGPTTCTEDRGIRAERIEVAGRGSREPVASNDNAEDRARNRRVEIFLREPRAGGH